MKTTMKKMMLAIMVIMIASANANAFEDSLKVNEEKSFDLVLSDVLVSTQVSLKDRRDNFLFTQTINKGEDFSKTFNLELLPSGEYKIEIENNIRIKVLTLQVDEEKIYTETSDSFEIFKPVISEKGATVFVSQFSPDQDPLYVAIYNSRNEKIYEETLKGKMDLGKKFDFTRSFTGEYRFYLESNGLSYDQLVYIEK